MSSSIQYNEIPEAYRLEQHLSKYQGLLIWPAIALEDALNNDYVMGLIDDLPALLWQSSPAKDELDRFMRMTQEQRNLCVLTGLPDAQDPDHPLKWLYAKRTTRGLCIAPEEILNELPGGECILWQTVEQARVEQERLVGVIESAIAKLRNTAVDPVSIAWTEQIDLEIRPIGDDERVLIGREGWGCTIVNYTPEGLALDVIAQGKLDAIHSLAIPCSDLTEDDFASEGQLP